MNKSIYTVILLSIFVALNAQTISVKSDELMPLVNVNILNLSDSSGKVTNSIGEASLTGWENTQIQISLVGYQTQNVFFSGKDLFVVLSPEIKSLEEVKVEGFLFNGDIREQPGSISKLDAKALNRFDGTNLTNAVNTTPGIRFEQRAAASYRISIRGSSIRSPFGIRNVKVYWNGIPFTEPGGNTFLNLLDLSNIDGMEIMKGPSASVYGAGNGGVLKLTSTQLGANANSTSVGFMRGDFNTTRLTARTNILSAKSSLTFKWSNQSADGYREHNAMDRSTFEVDAQIFNSEKTTFLASLLYSNLDYQIPGGLNPDQRAENPRQPRPRSVDQNSSLQNELFLFRGGVDTELAPNWHMKTNLGLSSTQFENPFILDYKRDNQQVFSARTEFTNMLNLGSSPSELSYGFEIQKSNFDGKNFGNVNGQLDTIRFADNIEITNAIGFVSYNRKIDPTTTVTLGGSYNFLTYDINRTIDRINANPQDYRKEFDPFFALRAGISKQLSQNYSVHLSYSNGLSNPTTTEVRTNEGSLNRNLQAEEGRNLEANLRGSPFRNFSFDLAVFQFNLENAITNLTDPQGVVLFTNFGETIQRGVELSTKIDWLNASTGFIESLSSTMAYTYHDFKFENYVDDGEDFSGNALPGTAPHVFNFQTDFIFSNGIYLNLTYHYSDPIPLNDENTFYSEAYNLVNTKLGYQGTFKEKTNFELYVGIDNLLDVTYSLGNDLNAFGRRYFQPAATRNFYFGLKVNLKH